MLSDEERAKAREKAETWNQAFYSFKRCRVCGEDKPPGEFYPDPRYRDGLATKCKDCTKSLGSEWKAANPDRRRLANREQKRRKRVANRPAMETLVCSVCSRNWQRDWTCGTKPRKCTSCR